MLNEHIELALREADVHLFEIPLNHDFDARQLARLDELDIAPEDRERVLCEMEAFARNAIPRFVVEYRASANVNGRVRWRRARGSRVSDERGLTTHLVGSTQDITEFKESHEEIVRRDAEAAQRTLEQQQTKALVTRLEQAEAELRALNDSFDLAVRLFDFSVTEIVLPGGASPAQAAGTGSESWNGRGLRSMPLASYLDYLKRVAMPEDLPRVLELFESALRGEITEINTDCRVRAPSGDGYRWRFGRIKLYFDELGMPERCISFSHDDQPLKTAQEEAQRAAEHLRLATELSGVSIWGYDIGEAGDLSTAKSVFAVDRTFDELGYHDGDLPRDIAGRMQKALLPEDRPRFYAAVQACIADRLHQFDIEYRLVGKDGQVRWKLSRGITTRDATGRPLRFLGTSVDITQLKQTQDELQQVKDRLERALRASNTATWDLETPDGLLTSGIPVFHNAWEQCGYEAPSDPQLAAQVLTALLPPGEAEPFIANVQAFFDGTGREWELEQRVLHKDGTERWHLKRGTVERNADGRVTRFSGTSTDITERKQMEQALQRVKDRLELALVASKAYIWDTDVPDGKIVGAIPIFTNVWEHLGYQTPSDPWVAAHGISVVIPAGEAERYVANIQAFFDGTEREWEFEQKMLHKDGTERWHLKRGVVERNAEGRVTRFNGTSIDITDRKQMERELQRVKDRLELALLGSRTCVWDFDVPDGQIANAVSVFTNAWQLLGHEMPASPQPACEVLSALLATEDFQPFVEQVQVLFDGTGSKWEVEQRVLHEDGKERWLLGRGVLMRDESGRVTRWIGAAVDITDRKLIERALAESEERFRRTFENAAVGMILTDIDGKFLEYNGRFCEFLGYSSEELAGRCVFEFMDPDEAQLHLENQQCVVRGETPAFTRDARYFRKDGAVVWGNVTVSVIQRHADGTPVHVMGILQDITARKALEAEIRQGRETLELAMRGSDISVVVVDFHGGELNDTQQTFFNFWEPMGVNPATLPAEFDAWSRLSIHPDDYDVVLGSFRTAAEGRSPDYYVEHRFFHADGSLRWRLSRGTILYDDAGNVSRFLATAMDITRLKQIESELSRAREAAEAANRAKDEFLANVSHEIRTPMNAILGMTELALDSAPSDHQRQLLSTVRSAAKNLLGIINDLLDFSKIAAGKLTLDRAPFSLRAAVGDTLRALSVRAHRKGLEVLCHVGPDVPDALDGDAGRLRQVLMNLVGNAIKFTQSGEVEVEVEVEVAPSCGASLETQDVQLAFSVRDTGIGIAPEKQATIFHAFEQGDSSTTRNYGGTGLGLTISAQLVALMGGSITVQSAPGHGSKFRFTARFARSTRSDGATTSPERLADLRVLIVDDNETNRRILEEWLTSWRMQPTSVGNAAAAMDTLTRAHDSGSPFALVLLDARMPDTDGVTLAGQIRQHWGARSPRLILLSSGDNATLVAKSRVNGVLAFLLKPVQQSELLEAIWSVMNLDLTPPSTNAKPGEKPDEVPPLRVLVAEDNEFNVALLEELLRRRGHHARFARDGHAALDLALKLAPEDACDLMLLDLHMPGLDGFQVARAIREDEQGTSRHLPIIALTARSSAHDRERCIAAGMDEFLSKPIEAAALWAVMERLVRRRSPAGGVSPHAESHLLDPRAILRACDGEASLLERILVVFRRSLPNHMSRVRTVLGAGDFASLREAAHSLAGTVGTFSTLTADIALTLEDEALRQDLESCTALVERLEAMCDALLEETTTLSIDSLRL